MNVNGEYLNMIRYKVLVLYYIPENSVKSKLWWDGFVAGINLLQGYFDITTYNIAKGELPGSYLNSFDFILVKSNWRWVVDTYIRRYKLINKIKKGIIISGSYPLPTKKEMNFYDVLFFQTKWYSQFLQGHRFQVQAYGIDDSIMKPIEGVEKKYDWLSIGSLKEYKRFEKLICKDGSKIIVGDISDANYNLLELLKKNNIQIKDFISYKELAVLINQSRAVYIPSSIHGGGERAVWEAIACNVPVYIENDNPKLLDILNSPLMNHMHYANQIMYGILKTLNVKVNPNWLVNIPNTSIGLFNFHNGEFIQDGYGKLKIGSYCTFGKNIKLVYTKITDDFMVSHFNPVSRILNKEIPNKETNSIDYQNCITIGNDVFIGDNSILHNNIIINDGCSVAPNSVVRTNLPAYSICEGNPAKVVGYRFKNELIDLLLELRWWNWSIEKIIKNMDLFNTDIRLLDKDTILKLVNNYEVNIFQR